jgi:TRAP-type C4-dicarboxylate transport system permease small subunit
VLIERIHYTLVAVVGAIASWYGVRLCVLNHTLVTPGLSINLAVLYASAAVGGALLAVYAISMIVAPPPQTDSAH